MHFFSQLCPSQLLFNLCSVLVQLGVHHQISKTKMQVSFTREKNSTAWWEESEKRAAENDASAQAATTV